MTDDQRDQLRDAADTLLRASRRDDDVRHAMLTASAVLLGVVRNECDPWVERLADDLEDAGPAAEAYVPAREPRRAGAGWQPWPWLSQQGMA